MTTPLRTLADLVREGSTQYEHIERAIFDLAVQKSLIKGLSTIREMEQLQKIEGISKGMQNLLAQAIDKVWTQASGKLEEWGRLAEPYTIGLSLEKQGFGTAVLCQYKSHYFLVTAGHVARTLRKASSVSMLLRFDHIRREYPSHPPQAFKVLEWDPSFEENTLNNVLENQPKDQGFRMKIFVDG
ncbi:MAG: hypothetical protein JSR80_08410 [Verrucomicrobia bacterium]|nr:hypothetical protein [Verrucomicrobiota bacterium]